MEALLNTVIDSCQEEDTVLWSASPNGKFNQKATYNNLMNHLPLEPQFSLVWGKWNVPKHSFIAWQLLSGSISTQNRLIKHGVLNSSSCVFCQTSRENARHLFFNCPFSATIWNKVKALVGMDVSPRSSEAEWFYIIQNNAQNCQLSALMNNFLSATIYATWRERNGRIFKHRKNTADEVYASLVSNLSRHLQLLILEANDTTAMRDVW